MNLNGKTAAILGGGGGIGREIALALASENVALVVGDIDVAAARAVAEEIVQAGGDAHSAVCDIGVDDSVIEFADTAFSRLGRVDIVFNHAGASLGGVLEQISSADWNWLLNLNVTGLGRSVSAFLPRMTQQGGGWIVNTSSGLGLFHDVPFAAPYIATKAAIIAYSRALATYVCNRGIGVSVFCPDVTMTGFLSAGRLVGIPPELAAAALPSDRLQTAAQAAALLISGLKADSFLISAVPDTQSKLSAMAEASLLPGSDAFDPVGRPIAVIQKGQLRLPVPERSKGLALFSDFAETSRSHSGCRSYDFACDPLDDNLIFIFEYWESQSALDAHAATPETLAFVTSMFELGASDFRTSKVNS